MPSGGSKPPASSKAAKGKTSKAGQLVNPNTGEKVEASSTTESKPAAKPNGSKQVKEGHTSDDKASISDKDQPVQINRAPVLTLWVAVVAERQGFSKEAGLTFGKAISGMLAQSKGRCDTLLLLCHCSLKSCGSTAALRLELLSSGSSSSMSLQCKAYKPMVVVACCLVKHNTSASKHNTCACNPYFCCLTVGANPSHCHLHMFIACSSLYVIAQTFFDAQYDMASPHVLAEALSFDSLAPSQTWHTCLHLSNGFTSTRCDVCARAHQGPTLSDLHS